MSEDLALAEGLRDFYLKAHRLLDEAMKREGISFARFKLLHFIDRTESARATDIADFFGYAPRTVTEAVDALEREHLVARTPDPRDRRVKNIAVTEAGRAIVRQTEPLRQLFMAQVFDTLAPPERALLLNILARLRARMDMLTAALAETPAPA